MYIKTTKSLVQLLKVIEVLISEATVIAKGRTNEPINSIHVKHHRTQNPRNRMGQILKNSHYCHTLNPSHSS